MSVPQNPYGSQPQYHHDPSPYGQPAQPPYGSQPGPQQPHFGAPPPPGPYGPPPYGTMPPPPPKSSGGATALWVTVILVLLVAAGGAGFYFLAGGEGEADCAVAAGDEVLLGCVEPSSDASEDSGGDEAANPLAHPDAVDLTAGLEPFEQSDGWLSFTTDGDAWVPEPPEGEGWFEAARDQLNQAQLGYDLYDGSEYRAGFSCYGADDREVDYDDFTDDRAVFDGVFGALRTLRDERIEYDLVEDPEFEHYLIDGHAVLVGSAEVQWTRGIDAEGEVIDVDWTELWGFIAIERGEDDAAICSYGSWDYRVEYEAAEELLLGIRMTS